MTKEKLERYIHLLVTPGKISGTDVKFDIEDYSLSEAISVLEIQKAELIAETIEKRKKRDNGP